MGLIADEVLDRHDHRRVADDARLAVDERGELAERLHAVLRARLGDVALERPLILRRRLGPQLLGQLLDVDPRVPEVEVARGRELLHPLAVRTGHLQVDPLPRPVVEGPVPAGDREACDKTLDVPLERSRKRLVEVVDAEDELAVRGGKRAEVREVGVTAKLGVHARARHPREIRGHQVGAAAEERERRDEHAPVADRHELGHPRLRLLLEQVDRIRAVRRWFPVGVDTAPHVDAGRPAARGSLVDGEVLDPRRLRRRRNGLRFVRARAHVAPIRSASPSGRRAVSLRISRRTSAPDALARRRASRPRARRSACRSGRPARGPRTSRP